MAMCLDHAFTAGSHVSSLAAWENADNDLLVSVLACGRCLLHFVYHKNHKVERWSRLISWRESETVNKSFCKLTKILSNQLILCVM